MTNPLSDLLAAAKPLQDCVNDDLHVPYKAARQILSDALAAVAQPAQPVAGQQEPRHEHFELWWADYVPELTRDRAWDAFCAALSRSEAPVEQWPKPQLAKNDPNHDLVPTLRMMDGLMFDRAADEIERWRHAYWNVVCVPARKLTVVGDGVHRTYSIAAQPTCINGRLIVHTDDPSLTDSGRSETPGESK